jgi:uracil-DNA glycosylase
LALGRRALQLDGSYGRSIPFYGRVLARAEELLERPAVLGADVAFTEVVHCKSVGEVGVKDALDECSTRYLERVLAVAAAKVIVVLGKAARRALNDALPATTTDTTLTGSINLGGRPRLVCYLPHPNAHMKRTFADVMPADLPVLRTALRG